MGYSSLNKRKPFERASMVNHSQIIQNKLVEDFLDNCEILIKDLDEIEYPQASIVDLTKIRDIKHVFTIDGGYSETYIERGFPSISLAFFNFGVLAFDMEDLNAIDSSVIINPEDLKKLKELGKIPLAIPAQNITIKGCRDFTHSVRKTIFDFFNNKDSSALENEPLFDVLRWLLFEEWNNQEDSITLDFCPHEGCESKKTIFERKGENEIRCSKCGKEVYLTDYFRFHEIINEPNGAVGIFGYLTSLIEQILIIQIIKYFIENSINKLSDILFIKDGPLAFFGQTFRLHKPLRNLIKYLSEKGTNQRSLINIVGLEKSGPFVEHAFYIKDKLLNNHFYVLSDQYIKENIIAQGSDSIYGHNTYYGWKVIYKTEENDILVLSIPIRDYNGNPQKEDFINIDAILSVLSKLRCNMYENSLVPIALINKLVSISEFPSSKIIEKFIKSSIIE